jgi:hypothetical protein
MFMGGSNSQPWWIAAHERPVEVGRIMDALVEAGLCDWTARTKPHPQDYALVAWWILREADPELLRSHDLLRRIRASLEDGSLEIPDVIHAVEAEITEMVGK